MVATAAATQERVRLSSPRHLLPSSLLDCLGRVGRVKARPHAVASRVLAWRPRTEVWQLSRRTEEDQGTAISAARAAVRRAISGPLIPVTSGLSRPLADTPPRRSGGITGPDGTDSQADSASSILVTRSKHEGPGQDDRPGRRPQVLARGAGYPSGGIVGRAALAVSRPLPSLRPDSQASMAAGGPVTSTGGLVPMRSMP
jgi:hypothetical protein